MKQINNYVEDNVNDNVHEVKCVLRFVVINFI